MSVRANIVANFAGQGWRMLMAFAFVPVYISYLGIEAYGLIGLLASLQAWIALLDFGLRPALGREMARFSAGALTATQARTLLRTIEWVGAMLALFIIGSSWLGSSYFASHWIRESNLSDAALSRAGSIMGVVMALSFLESIYSSCLVALQRQVIQNILTCVIASVRSVGAVAVLAFWSPSVDSFMAWQALVGLFSLMIISSTLYSVLPQSTDIVRFSIVELGKIWRFAAGALTISFLGLVLSQADRILLSRLLTLEAFGYYALAATVTAMMSIGIAPIANAYFPRFTQLITQGDEVELARVYHHATQLVAAVLAPASAILILFGREALVVWTGDSQLAQAVAPVMALLAAGSFCNGLMGLPYYLQLAAGWTRLVIMVNIPAVLVLIPSLLFFAPQYGVIAGGWCWFLLNAFYILVQAHFMHRRLLRREKWRWYANGVLLPILSSALVAVMFRIAAPADIGRVLSALYLILCGASMMVSVILVAPLLRKELAARLLPRLASKNL